MKKIFHFEAPREQYICDGAIVWCFDNRFEVGFQKFLKRLRVVHTDPIKIAGGAKPLASPERESDREFILDQIHKSKRLHSTKRVILMVHSDCGAYGGLSAFGNDRAREAAHHENQLRVAARCVRNQFPEMDVDAYFVDFEGVWEVDTEVPIAV